MGKPAAALQEKPEARDAQLRAFLREVSARQMWGQRVPHVGMIECYVASGRLFVVQVFQRGAAKAVEGWDVFIPADTTGKIDATLDALRAYINGAA